MRSRSVLVIIATLIIGFAIGFLTNAHLTRKKIQSFVKMGTSTGFKNRIYHIMRPDPAQRKAIDPILEKYSVEIHESVARSRSEIRDIHIEMMKELKPYLTDEQITRMENTFKRFEGSWKGNPHRKPPPHRMKRPAHKRPPSGN